MSPAPIQRRRTEAAPPTQAPRAPSHGGVPCS